MHEILFAEPASLLADKRTGLLCLSFGGWQVLHMTPAAAPFCCGAYPRTVWCFERRLKDALTVSSKLPSHILLRLDPLPSSFVHEGPGPTAAQ